MQYPTLDQPDIRVGKAKTTVIIHRPIHSWRLLGVRVCETCGERWGREGCRPLRDAITLLVTHAARTNASGLRRLLADLPEAAPRKNGGRRRADDGRPAGVRPGRRGRIRARHVRRLGAGIYKTGMAA